MKLADLAEAELAGLGPEFRADLGAQIVTGFAIDNRKVASGTIFGAFRGAKFNGEDFIPAAIEAGAIAVVARPEVVVDSAKAVHFASDEPRKAFAHLAAKFFTPVPANVAAVTGTNGKTSVAEMARQIWQFCGNSSASIGTLGVTTCDGSVSTGLTTPDIVTFLGNMTGLAREGVSHVVYEASSHGLDQYRNEGLPVKAGAFTNLSRDHLDYHGDMDSYFQAKMRLFSEVVETGGTAVIWADDAWSGKACDVAGEAELTLFTIGAAGKDIQLISRVPSQLGQVLEIIYQGEVLAINLPLIGAYQASNALVAAGLVLAISEAPKEIAPRVFDALSRLTGVAGRLERAAISPAGAPIYVDYAHTPDALAAAITALRPHTSARIITVFGAGGDRDTGKRAPMGAVAAQHSDFVIVTDDNPRGEDAASIRKEILKGASGAMEIGDRRKAIAAGIAEAGPADIVLIAGKGHEQGQIVGTGEMMRILPFDDVSVARECAAIANQGVSGREAAQ